MTFKDNLILLSLILKKDRCKINDFLKKTDLDFNYFSDFLRKNRIDGFLYFFLKENDLSDIVPVDKYKHYRYHYKYQQTRNNRLFNEAKYLNDLISGSNIDLILLKGPLFTFRFYDDLGQREIADLDILVRKNGSIEKTDQLLKKHGFVLRSIPLFGRGNAIRFTHHYEYIKEGVKLDLHWVLQSHFSFNIDYNKIWKTRQNISICGTEFYVLSKEYEIVFRILSIFMDIQLGTIRFKSLLDLYIIFNKIYREIEWQEFFDLREKEGLYLISLNVIDLVLDLLDCKELFHELSNIINNDNDSIEYKDYEDKLLIFESQRFSIRNKYWAYKCYNAPIHKSLIWWLASMPVKLLIYKEASGKSLRRLFKR